MPSLLFEKHLFKDFRALPNLCDSIERPNSSGQGYDVNHQRHALHSTAIKNGYKYSHSTPIHQNNGEILTHHTWAKKEAKVGSYEGSQHWNSKVSSASCHQTTGHGAAALDKHLKGKRYNVVTEELSDEIAELLLTAFATAWLDDDDDDLDASFQDFAEFYDLSNDDFKFLRGILIAAGADDDDNEDEDDYDPEEKIRSFLSLLRRSVDDLEKDEALLDILHQPFSKPTTRYPNQSGLSPLAGEHGIKSFLKQVPIQSHPDPYGNQGFSADKYKTFDRGANRFGHPYEPYNDQRPSRPLANPTLNVSTTKSFRAVDSVGMGATTHWRVVNVHTGEYETNKMPKNEAEELTHELNQKLRQKQIDEKKHIPSCRFTRG